MPNSRWLRMPPDSDNTKEHSIYRYVLEADTPEGLQWCGSFSTAKRAWADRLRYRTDWKYKVYDCYEHKIVTEVENGTKS